MLRRGGRGGASAAAAGTSKATGTRTKATYPAMKMRAIGNMEFGSVPTPPRKPKSSTRTQSARQNGTNATRPARASRGRPLKNSPPMVARTTTAKRLTAHPWAATKFSKDETHEDRNPGCGVWAIVRTMPVSVPPRPCQKPRPGHACSTAIPIRNTPLNPSTTRPRRAVA